MEALAEELVLLKKWYHLHKVVRIQLTKQASTCNLLRYAKHQ